tara:strand:+ start:11079 stop:12944 length:1866 start_codon:yes stop_codon:yes gene_type:complete
MSIKTELAKYGSGIGIIYLTDYNDIIKYQKLNDKAGREESERLMLVSSTLSSNISATSVVEVTASGGNITNLSYNGVSVFNTTTPVTGATTTALASALALAINSYVSTPQYTAVSSGSFVTVYLSADQGDSLNGQVAGSSVTGTATLTATALNGGSYSSTSQIDTQIGYKIYLNSSVSAVVDTLVGATDITSAVLRKSSASPYTIRESQISSGSISVNRDTNITIVNVQTEGSVAADDLTSIDAGIFNDGDVIVLIAKESAKVTTVKEGGNIELSNGVDFITGAKDFSISLRYSTSDNKWYESSRSPGTDLSVSSLRSAGIATPIQGVEVTVLATTGGTVNLVPGVDKGYISLTGTGTLTGSWNYTLGAGVVDGDTFIIDYNGLFTPGANTVNLFGITLTAAQVLEGNVVAKAVYSSSLSAWVVTLFRDTQAVDLADETDLALKENSLGDPSVDAYILSSTAAGVRSWVSNNSDIALSGDSVTNGNTSNVLTTLRTITIPSATLTTNGSVVVVKYGGQFGSNGTSKSLRANFNSVEVIRNTQNLTPNGASFIGEIIISRASSNIVKISSSIIMMGLTTEVLFTQITGLNLNTTSYDVTLQGVGTSASDVTIYNSIATKIIV